MLNQKELMVFEGINDYIKNKGISPSVRDVCRMAGFSSTSSAYRYIEKLKEEGLIDTKAGLARSITIKEPIA